MKFRVAFLSKAREELTTIGRWWSANRPENPRLFREELAEALARVKASPDLGEHVEGALDGVRRVLLPRSRYYIYYQVERPVRTVVVLAAWHTSRGGRPPLL